jgi:O-antigen/teichoic acid export membrane protein
MIDMSIATRSRAALEKIPAPVSRMAANGGWLGVGTVLRMGINLVAGIWLTRYLGPASYGLYAYVLSFVLIVASMGSAGMSSLVTRELVERPDDRRQILGSAIALRAIGGIVGAGVLVVAAFAFHQDADYRIGLIAFGAMLLLQPLEALSYWYEAQTRSKYVVISQLVASGVYVALIASFMAAGRSALWFLLARLAEFVLIQLGVLAFFAFHGGRPTELRPQRERSVRMASEAWPLVLSAVGATLYLRVDQVMLGRMTSDAEVGIYAAAARISEVWYFIPLLIASSAFPYLLRLREDDVERYRQRLQQLYDLLFWLGLSIAVVIALGAPFIIHLLYGDPYSASAPILRVHVWAGVFIFMRAAFSKWLIAERLLVFSLVTQGAGAVVNILLNLVLIPRFGGIGAAWATVLSYAAASYLALMLFRSTREPALMMTRAVLAPLRLGTPVGAPTGGGGDGR